VVDLFHYIVPDLFSALGYVASAKHCLELVLSELSVAIRVDHIEGSPQVLGGDEQSLFHRSRDKLSVVNLSIPVGVTSLEKLNDVWFFQVE